jgi:hypothetical protein
MAPLNPNRARWQLLLVVAVFALPLVVALAMHLGDWRPARTQNYGQLLAPALELGAARARYDSDAQVPWSNAEGRWLLLVRVPPDCADPCWNETARLPRLRLALGRFAPRLDLLLLDRAPPAALRAQLAPMRYATLEPPAPEAIAHDPEDGPALWLVDPHGFLVLSYRAGYDLDRVVQDLKRLIR